MGISCSPVEPLPIRGAASQDQARGQPRQQQWLDQDASVRKTMPDMYGRNRSYVVLFSMCSVLWVYPRTTDARTKAVGPVGVEGASLGSQVQSLGA